MGKTIVELNKSLDLGVTETDQARQAKECSAGNLFVITGPSGVGKGTVVEGLLAAVPSLGRSVSVTTRPKRANEKEGIDYFFVNREKFAQLRQNHKLLEWAEFAGSFYGTPRVWVEEKIQSGQDVILVIEVQGAKQIRQFMPTAILIFLSPPSFSELESRLRGRATESNEKIALRLKKAKDEMKQKHLFHYEVINDNVDKAVSNLAHIIYAERLKIRTSPNEHVR